MIILGLGIDATDIPRIARAFDQYGERFLRRVFTEGEIAYCTRRRNPVPHLAGRFAAKEAVLKALKVRPKKSRQLSGIEVGREATGKPFIILNAKSRQELRIPAQAQIELSIAHEREYAIATVVIVIP